MPAHTPRFHAMITMETTLDDCYDMLNDLAQEFDEPCSCDEGYEEYRASLEEDADEEERSNMARSRA